MEIEVGTKIFDLEEPGVWGLVWRVRAKMGHCRFTVKWCDGSTTHGAHTLDIEEGFYAIED